MADKTNRTCICCGEKYYYCNTCREHMNKPAWMRIYHDENCKNIFNTVSEYLAGAITKDEARAKFDTYDLSYKEQLNHKIIKVINEVYDIDEATEEAVDVVDKSNEEGISMINEVGENDKIAGITKDDDINKSNCVYMVCHPIEITPDEADQDNETTESNQPEQTIPQEDDEVKTESSVAGVVDNTSSVVDTTVSAESESVNGTENVISTTGAKTAKPAKARSTRGTKASKTTASSGGSTLSSETGVTNATTGTNSINTSDATSVTNSTNGTNGVNSVSSTATSAGAGTTGTNG